MEKNHRSRLVAIATGGTISSKVDTSSGKTVATLSGSDLLARLPDPKPDVGVEIQEFSRIQCGAGRGRDAREPPPHLHVFRPRRPESGG